VGAGDSVGDADGLMGSGDTVGVPWVGFGVGDLEIVGAADDSVGASEGAGDGEYVGWPIG
jgi:hypothetical protein